MRLLSEFAAWFTIHGDLLPHQGMCLDDRRYSSIKETTMSQMKIADRNRIEFLIALGWPLPKIAADLGRSPSTIRNELLRHRIDSDKGYGCSNRICARFDGCLRKTFSAHGEVLRRNSCGCFESCPDFREAVCLRLSKPPFVCNGCQKERVCALKKKFYIASAAQTGYEATLRLSRTGIHPSDNDIQKMNDILSPSICKGQSVSAIMNTHESTFKGYARSTVYGWIKAGLFSAKGHDLPFAGRSRKPKPKPETKTNAKCRIGRTIAEMREWLKKHENVVPCELDTVIGSVSGKVLFTMIFPKSSLALGFLRERKTSNTCTRIFNMLWEKAGAKLFRKLFAAILTDNGTEFSDPDMIERFRPDPEHNPTKLDSRGIKVWFTDPYCSSQKPHIERFHLDLRRILQKGTSFNMLSQEGVNLVFSNLNSYPRESLNGMTPYDKFIAEYGQEGCKFLDALGIERIPAAQVTLHPFLLGQNFQRAADKAILRKSGVTDKKIISIEK